MPTPPDPAMRTMRRATELTRMGRLAEATRAIQSALGAAPADPPAPGAPTDGATIDGATIDGEVVGRGARTKRPEPATRTMGETGGATGAEGRGGIRLPGAHTAERTRATLDALRTARIRLRAKAHPTPHSMSHPTPRPTPDAPTAPGARWEWRAGPDGRRYRLYVPASLGDTSGAPLVVMLHGCTQGPDDFAVGTRMNVHAERVGAVIAYPEQTRGENMMACWNWFEPAHQSAGGEPGSITAIAREVGIEFGTGRTVVAGLSAGGAMAAILGATHPETFAAVGIHSGLPVGAARDLASAQRAMARGAGSGEASSVPTIVVHGEADRTVHPANGTAAFDAAAGSLPRTERLEGRASVTVATGPDGVPVAEHWRIPGLAHAWAGGDARGSHTDPGALDATEAMLAFFLRPFGRPRPSRRGGAGSEA